MYDKPPTQDQIQEIIRQHEAYLLQGKGVRMIGGKRADFTHADLSEMNLIGLNLRSAIFDNCNLDGTMFADSDLTGAIFSGAHLNGTDFTNARLKGAGFSLSTCENVCFSEADLRGATFRHATLIKPSFEEAVLTGADFSHASLVDPKMGNAILLRVKGLSYSQSFLKANDKSAPKSLSAIRLDGGDVLIFYGSLVGTFQQFAEEFSACSPENVEIVSAMRNCVSLLSQEPK